MTRFWLLVVDFRWVIVGVMLALSGVISLFVHVAAAVQVVLATVTLVVVIQDLVARHQLNSATHFSLRTNDTFEDVRDAVQSSERFKFLEFPRGSFLIDLGASDRIKQGLMQATLRPTNYVLPLELRSVGHVSRRRYVNKHPSAYNGPVLGLDTDLGFHNASIPSTIRLVGAKYFDHLSSDVLAGQVVQMEGRLRPDLGRGLFINRDNRPRDFGESWLLNAIGTSVICITTDGKLVVVVQTENNESSPGLYSPSGSGFLEAQDFRDSSQITLDALAANGALRELSEEAGIEESEVVSIHFLGFARWLDKAGRPELLSLAFLDIDSHTALERSVPTADRAFTSGNQIVRFATRPERWTSSQFGEMIAASERRQLSVPLAASLALLADEVNERNSSIAMELASRLRRETF